MYYHNISFGFFKLTFNLWIRLEAANRVRIYTWRDSAGFCFKMAFNSAISRFCRSFPAEGSLYRVRNIEWRGRSGPRPICVLTIVCRVSLRWT